MRDLENNKNYLDFCEYLLLIVSNVLGKKAQGLYLDSPISQFGLDSIDVTKIVAVVNSAFKLKISPVNLYGHKTVKGAATDLFKRFVTNVDFSELTQASIQMLCDEILNGAGEKKEVFEKNTKDNDPSQLVQMLSVRAQKNPDFVAYTLLDAAGNKANQITYGELYRKSLLVAKTIKEAVAAPEKIILLFDKNADFIYALFATFYSGAIAVPFAAPAASANEHYRHNLLEVVKNSKANIIFTTRRIFSQLNNFIAAHDIKFVIYDDIVDDQNIQLEALSFEKNPFALIQYSSGLSGHLKGVLYSYTDLYKHLERIQNNYHLVKESRALSWVPAYHYMGLFYGILQPFYSEIPAYLYVEIDAKFHAKSWLSAISQYRISFTGGPEFAYAMCNELAAKGFADQSLNLSSWSIAYVGGETITRAVIEQFINAYQTYGFKRWAMYPSYGMAEAPLLSTSSIAEVGEPGEIISSGKKISQIDIQIINPATKVICKEGEVGELWFAAKGNECYMQEKGQPNSIYNTYFNQLPYVRTGDMGYQIKDMFYVCGKLDDFEQLSGGAALFITSEAQQTKDLIVKQPEPIAVIGMAGLFPQSDSCAEFWNHLEAGKDLIAEIPENRWDWKKIYGNPDNENQITDIKWGGFINDIEAFDASFFNISPKEAQLMDPMQRKLIQVVWQAVEDAGYRMSDYAGKKIGVFVGIGTFDYLQLVLENNKFTHAYAGTGLVHCMASNRVSYLFDFTGPSESVDTACSSSLVALHRAVGVIRNNECEMAIVCGANVMLSSSLYVALSNADMLSKSGKCRTFDDSADGYVRGEGVAAIVLKKLNAAQKDADHIYGLIKGAAVNHGGHTSSLTAPNPFAQAEVIDASLKDAAIDASTISYVETHGTATALGDPIEVSGLASAFAAATMQPATKTAPYCALGSVKTNIGHLEAAAGIAGVIKVLLAMRHQKIPAHLHLTVQNKNINLDETPFYFCGETKNWEPLKNETGEIIPRRAGVSSFGFGGVNAHVTLEEYQGEPVANNNKVERKLFIFSAKTEKSMRAYVASYCHFIKVHVEAINLINMAYTLQVGRESFEFRLAIIASSAEELLEKLMSFNSESALATHASDDIYYAKAQRSSSKPVSKSSSEIINALETKNIEALAQLWVAGGNIDWKCLYLAKPIKRMSLPTYPFEKTYHWISDTKSKENVDANLIKDTYDVNWYAEQLAEVKENNQCDYILFCDNKGVSKNLSLALHDKNIRVHKIYYKDVGEASVDSYCINPTKKESYLDVFSKIRGKSKNKKFYVLNFWSLDFVDSDEPNLADLSSDYRFICQTALYQLQALTLLCEELKAHFWIICSNVQDIQNNKINLSSAPLWGMARTLMLEQPLLFRSIIDINLNEAIDIENLLKEVNSFSDEGEVVYRQGVRYVPRMEPCQVASSNGKALSPDGSYLITGGLGTLGLLVAEWLSSLKVKKVYLLSRRGVEQNKNQESIKETIKRIESQGTRVEVLQGDVTNLAQMTAIANNFFNKKDLRGVFHLAGSYQESLLENMDFAEFENVVSAKVEGTWILHEIFKNVELDCFVMYASGASIWGAATAGHYSAANYFLDAYADYCKAHHFPALSISWGGLWRASGIIPKNKEEYFKSIGVKETSPEEGITQLAAIIYSNCLKKVIAPIEWPLFLEVVNAQRKKMLFNKIAVNSNLAQIDKVESENKFIQELNVSYSEEKRYSLVFNQLKTLLKNILGVDDVEANTGFFSLGLDSLASIDFKNKINKAMGIKISTTTLFDCNTLQLLSQFLLSNYFQMEAKHETMKENNNSDEFLALNNASKNELLKFLELELANTERGIA